MLELTNERRSVSEQCSSLVDVRDNERTERRQPDPKGMEGSGDLVSRRFDRHQTCESVLMNTLRYRHHHRLLVVDALDTCDGAATVSTCSARRCFSRRSYVCASWLRLLAPPPCCHADRCQWTWMRLCRSSVQLPCLASSPCHGAAPVSTSRARHCRGQRLSVRRSLMGDQAWRQPAPPTTHERCLSTSYRRSYTSTLTSVSCRRWFTRRWSMWICRAVVDAVPPAADGFSRRLRPRCDSLPRPRSI